MELRINRVRINRARPVLIFWHKICKITYKLFCAENISLWLCLPLNFLSNNLYIISSTCHFLLLKFLFLWKKFMFLDHFCGFIDRIRSKVIPKMIMHSVYLTEFCLEIFSILCNSYGAQYCNNSINCILNWKWHGPIFKIFCCICCAIQILKRSICFTPFGWYGILFTLQCSGVTFGFFL